MNCCLVQAGEIPGSMKIQRGDWPHLLMGLDNTHAWLHLDCKTLANPGELRFAASWGGEIRAERSKSRALSMGFS